MNQLVVHSLVKLALLHLQEAVQALSAMRVLLVSIYLDLHVYYALLESLATYLEALVKVEDVLYLALSESSAM